jgi:hypothetical protein
MPLAPRVQFRVAPRYVQFRAGDGLAEQLAARADRAQSLGLVAQRDLARYYSLLERELARIPLSEAEASLIVDACNGVVWEPHTAPLLWADIDDAIRHDGLDRKWGVDGAALVARLRDLSPCAQLALADAAERYWAAAGAGDQRSNADLLRAVGLVLGSFLRAARVELAGTGVLADRAGR